MWGDRRSRLHDPLFEKPTGVKITHDRGASPVERITKIKVALDNQMFDIVHLHDGIGHWP